MLGWPLDRIIIIDTDLGQSGASAADREGFQRLVAEVGLGQAGIVLGLEVSRLARNSMDWHRLLEICALTDTLILDEDGVYEGSNYKARPGFGRRLQRLVVRRAHTRHQRQVFRSSTAASYQSSRSCLKRITKTGRSGYTKWGSIPFFSRLARSFLLPSFGRRMSTS